MNNFRNWNKHRCLSVFSRFSRKWFYCIFTRKYLTVLTFILLVALLAGMSRLSAGEGVEVSGQAASSPSDIDLNGLEASEATSMELNGQALNGRVESNADKALSSQPALRVTIVSIPGLSFMELDEAYLASMPNIRKLLQNGKLAAMNVRTKVRGIESSYLTLGASAPAIGNSLIQGYHPNEWIDGQTAESLYRRYLGASPGEADIVIPGVRALQSANLEKDYGAQIGILGDVLAEQGIGVYVLGNLDQANPPLEANRRRYAPLMVMNRDGLVQAGSMGSDMLLDDPERPFGLKTNGASLLQQWMLAAPPVLALIELGDLSRLYEQQMMYDSERFRQLKRNILAETDAFLGQLRSRMQPQDVLYVLSPLVHMEAWSRKSMLTPLLYFKEGMQEGFLTSPTTRRIGIVSAYDIAPSVMEEFAIKERDVSMLGRTLQWNDERQTLSKLRIELARIEQVYRLRPHLIYSFAVYEIIVLLFSLLLALRNWERALMWMKIPLLLILASPLIMLWMGWLASFAISIQSFFFIVALLSTGWLLSRFQTITALGIAGAACTLFIMADALAGGYAMKHSVMGYDPMIGARYYGIGNEYMGVLVGAAVLAASAWLQRQNDKRTTYLDQRTVSFGSEAAADLGKWAQGGRAADRAQASKGVRAAERITAAVIGTAFAAAAIYLAAPGGGTNAGGALTATIAFGLAWIRFFGGDLLKEIRWQQLIFVLGALFACGFAALWLMNAAFPAAAESQSHIGRALQLVLDGRLDVIADMIRRKLAMNWHLLGVSSWSKVLITGLLVIAAMLLRPRGILRQWQQRYPYMMYGFSATSVGTIAALALNDSGIVAAATMIGYAAVPMLLLRMTAD